MKIQHRSLFDTKTAEEIYSKKDGVPVKYVCTSGSKHSTYAMDIFYREKPHPEFGNRYFGLYSSKYATDLENRFYITTADWIEDLTFAMIYADDKWHYSSHRWDMVQTSVGFIDGGREYTRLGGNTIPKATTFVVRDGKFMEKSDESTS